MLLLLIVSFVICAIFLGSSGLYYSYMKRMAKKPWRLSIDDSYKPSVSILVPVHNEEKTIQLKLRNLSRINYNPEKTEIVVVNDASTDKTLTEIDSFRARNPNLGIRVVSVQEHLGKTNCLNLALKSLNSEIIVVSDADCFWSSDILARALPFMSDPTVGAVTGLEWLLNPYGSWVTAGEEFFDKTVQSMRVGESKVHSTIFFQGGFAAYKHKLVNEFDQDADDSGTALDIIQRNCRTLLLPEIGFYTPFPTVWKNKITLKVRRASQLQHLLAKCLNLLVRRKLRMPKRIAAPQIFLHIFNPLLLIALAIVSVFGFIQLPMAFLAFLLILCPILLIRKTRTILIEVLQNNCILLAALPSFLTSKRFKPWKTVQESRYFITEDLLKEKKLI